MILSILFSFISEQASNFLVAAFGVKRHNSMVTGILCGIGESRISVLGFCTVPSAQRRTVGLKHRNNSLVTGHSSEMSGAVWMYLDVLIT